MVWHNDDNDASQEPWPTWNSRLSWARNNYQRKPEQDAHWRLQKLLVLLANLVALSGLMEEKDGELIVSHRLRRQWEEMYETYRPTNPPGRPKKD